MLSLLVFFGGFMLFSTANWVIRKFGPVTYEQIVFHLNMPFDSETRLMLSYFKNTIMTGIILLVVLALLFCRKYRLHLKALDAVRDFVFRHRMVLSLGWFAFCVIWFCLRMNVWTMLNYRRYKSETSNFYEQNYVLPQHAKITFPKHKRNLVLIFMESMEATYAKTPHHDYFDADLIPELHLLAKQNINFSDNEYIGGAYPIDGTQWTQAGLFAQTCGAPIQLPINDANFFHPKNSFYPNAWCLYDILRQKGYEESFLIGSNGEFAGMNRFVETHGRQKLLDTLFYAERDGLKLSFEKTTKLPDKQLFAYAKEELMRLSAAARPFVFTLMTLDTHYGTAKFADDICQRKYGTANNIKNVVSCSSYQIAEFVDWLKAQSFYSDTVVVLLGDHLTMNNFFTPEMNRKPLNIFVNSPLGADKTKNRIFTPFDIYPTVIESLGAKISGHRLGLGTSLFSDIPTLTESKMSIEEMDEGVRKSSKIYDWLLYGKSVRD
ncbi:MAG: sulfatase-like hydrolase/transferase [Alphaproteobacteria bacterium]|nr:sulfatase-like hydrolase/transferase [Alphaproteobacteria bacterium]MBQ9234846.1 sulfatase-like hydrolase/transferase [Alphaproteobacteria bacterium]